jgi:tRNA threonylcarbamoyl adenosine modification protein YjeE
MKTEVHSSQGADATRALGAELGRRLHAGDLVTLSGPLGAGKTTFVQGLAQGLRSAEEITSPTFVLMIEHGGPIPLVHLDAYRLEGKCYDVIRDAGVIDLFDRDDAVKVVEWPECVIDFLPRADYAITFTPGTGEFERSIEVQVAEQVSS